MGILTISSVSTDNDADYLTPHNGDNPSESGKNAYGNIKQLYILKKKNRGLKTLLSIGGAGAAQKTNFAKTVGSANARKRFCKSAVELMANWGFDGLDVDYEYPENKAQADGLLKLLTELRAELNAFSKAQGQTYKYLLSAALPAGPSNYNRLALKNISKQLDMINLMAYDYVGLWQPFISGHQANLYPSKKNPSQTPFSTDKAVTDYLKAGAAKSKINIGIPLYGRSFAKTDGMGKSFKGTLSPNEDGTIPYNKLPKSGASVTVNSQIGTTHSYDKNKKEIVTYDAGTSTKVKAQYVGTKKLGGTFFWEASGDKTGTNSLIRTAHGAMTGTLNNSKNQLSYPTSKFDNIRKGMPGV